MNNTAPHPHIRGFQAMITPPQWQDLLLRGRRRSFPPGGRLLDQGARGEVVYALLEGRVRVVYTEADGNEVLVAIRGPGDLVGEYSQRDRGGHMASVWALEDCKAVAMTSEGFEGTVQRDDLSEPLQRYMLGKARQVGERVWRAANLNTEQRMAQLFLEVVGADPRSEATIPMSQGMIAASMGVTRRSVNEALSQWKRRGLVRTQPAPIAVLDLPAIARRANFR